MLTQKQELAVQKLIELGDQSKAYRAAYNAKNMSDETVWSEACRLFKNLKVAARIEELQARHQKRHEITIDRVLKEYSRLAFLDIRKAFDKNGHILPIDELDDDTASAIAGLEVESLFEGRGEDREHVGTLKKINCPTKRALSTASPAILACSTTALS